MPEHFLVYATAQLIPATEAKGVTISNAGAGTLYYGSTASVSASVNDGSLTTGQSVTRTSITYVISASVSRVSVTLRGNPDIADGSISAIDLESGAVPVNVLDYEAVADGVTDDAGAIQAAIDSIAGLGPPNEAFGDGGIVFMPPGVYIINSQLIVPAGVRLVGSGVLATQISAGGSFPVSTALVRLGDGSGEVNSCRLEDLALRCSGIAGSIGVYSTDIAEHSGLRNVRIDTYKAYGIKIEDTASTFPDNFVLRDIGLAPSDSAGTTGILYSMTNAGRYGGRIERATIAANGALHTAGIHIRGNTAGGIAAGMSINGLNVENHTDGILVDEAGTAEIAHAMLNVGGTNLVHLDADATGSVVCSWLKRTAGTNTVKNDVTSANITALNVSFYATDSVAGTVCLDLDNGFREVLGAQPSVASDTTITLPTKGNFIDVSGTTTIVNVTASYIGRVVTLRFTGSLSVSPGNVYVAGAFSTSAADTLTIACDGTNWYEIARSVNS